MKPKRRTAFQVESLESRALLSAVPHHGLVAAEAARPNYHRMGQLVGRIDGSFTAVPSNTPNLAEAYILGSGSVSPLGPVQAYGTIAGTPTPGSTVQGGLALLNTQGEVDIYYTATVPYSTRVTPRARLTVFNGTGAYAGLTGHGVGLLQIRGIARDGTSGIFAARLQSSLFSR